MKKQPSQTELEILQSLWSRGRATVRDIHEDIQEYREVGYTTTLKQVQRMQEAGLVRRVAGKGRAHQFRASASAGRIRNTLVDRLVSTAFAGSANALVLHALGRHSPSNNEISEIRALLDSLEQDEDA